MAGDSVVGHFDRAGLLQIADEIFHVAGDFVRIGAAESDVEEVVLAKNPAVAAHVAAEEKFGKIAGDFRFGRLRRVHLELDFLRHHRGRCTLVAEIARDRTEMSAGADQNSRPDVAVHQPAAVRALDRGNGLTLAESRSASPQQVFVELAAANAVADDALAANLDLRPANGIEAKAGNRLQGSARRVVLRERCPVRRAPAA